MQRDHVIDIARQLIENLLVELNYASFYLKSTVKRPRKLDLSHLVYLISLAC